MREPKITMPSTLSAAERSAAKAEPLCFVLQKGTVVDGLPLAD